MHNIDLKNIWQSSDAKIDRLLAINKEIAIQMTRQKLNRQISRLFLPKWIMIFLGIPYLMLLLSIATIAFFAKAYLVMIGFAAISLIMIILLLIYFHQLYLVNKVRHTNDVMTTQKQLSKLKLASYNSLNLAIFQLPFWSVCWISLNALKESPFIYGGVNLLVFIILTYTAYWLYSKMHLKNKQSKIRDFFLSGREWEPLMKSSQLLEQIKEYEE